MLVAMLCIDGHNVQNIRMNEIILYTFIDFCFRQTILSGIHNVVSFLTCMLQPST